MVIGDLRGQLLEKQQILENEITEGGQKRHGK